MSDNQKKSAAIAALSEVKDNMKLGLGTGSTAEHFIHALGEKVANGLNVICVPTSQRTADLATTLNINLTTLDETPELDLTVDGADEIDEHLQLIKGGGGALLREKIVASSSKSMVVIADASKQVNILGKFPLPIEVVSFGLNATKLAIGKLFQAFGLSGELVVRLNSNNSLFTTDGGNNIIDCNLDSISDVADLEIKLNQIPGVVENGLFVGLASKAYIGGPESVSILE